MTASLLIIHITTGALGIIAGFFALFAKKGSYWHINAGRTFSFSMLVTAVAIIGLGILSNNIDDMLSGFMIMYFIISAWRSLKIKTGSINKLDIGLFMTVFGLSAANFTLGYFAERLNLEYPAAQYYVVAAVLFIAVLDDLFLLIKHNPNKPNFTKPSTRYYLIRHSWRMCLMMFLATGSFFLGQMKVFPQVLIENAFYLFFIPPVLSLFALVYWIIRLNINVAFNESPKGEFK